MEVIPPPGQRFLLHHVLQKAMEHLSVTATDDPNHNEDLLSAFIAAKRVEGCSDRTIRYYESTLKKVLTAINKTIPAITTDDLRRYLDQYQQQSHAGQATIDNVHRILSSFFSWLVDKDHTLLQAICRTNRVYGQDKNDGLIVDYIGIFDNIAKALSFDAESVQKIITNVRVVRIPGWQNTSLAAKRSVRTHEM